MTHRSTSPDDSRPVEDQVATVAEILRLGAEGHPSARQLSAYHRGELEPDATETLRDHLAQCPECAELVLDLASFGDLGDENERRDWEGRRAAVWESLSESMPSAPAREPRAAASWLPLAAAAVLAVTISAVTIGLGGWWFFERQATQLALARAELTEAEQRITELEAVGSPWLVVPSHDLFPPSYERGDGPSSSLVLPSDAELFVLELHTLETGEPSTAELRILDFEGRELWSGEGLRRTPAGSFRLVVPRQLLYPGRYRLELHAPADGSAMPIADYELVIEHRPIDSR